MRPGVLGLAFVRKCLSMAASSLAILFIAANHKALLTWAEAEKLELPRLFPSPFGIIEAAANPVE